MIGNIKYFVKEHQTLIVVIISVLAICFLCWWLFCKGKSTGKKIKGGGCGWLVVKCDRNRIERKYFCMGMWVKNDDLPFYVLSEIGVEWIHETVIFGAYQNYKQKFMKIIESILDNVYSAVVDEDKTKRGRPIQRIFPNLKDGEIGEKVNTDGFSELDALKTNEKMLFSLSSYLNDGDKARNVLKEYKKMIEYIQGKAKGFVRKVVFIGQPAYSTLTATNVGGKVFEGNTKYGTVYSENRSDGVEKGSNDLYKTIEGRIRNWFNDGKGMYNIAYKGYVDTADGRIILHEQDVVQDRKEKTFKRKRLNLDGCKESRTKGPQWWEIADIYPAHKVILMVMFLIILYSSDGGLAVDINEYKKMLAAYILVAQLFNSFCASFMNSSYNKDIGNSYVYIYDKVGATDETPVFNMKGLDQLDKTFLGDSVAEKIRTEEDVDYLTRNWSHKQKRVLFNGLNKNLGESQERYFDESKDFTFFCVVMPQLDSTRDVRFPQHIGFVAEVSFDGRGKDSSTIFVSRAKFTQRPRKNECFLFFKVNNRTLRDCLGACRVVEGSAGEIKVGEYEREIILEIKDEELERTEVWEGGRFRAVNSQMEFESVKMNCIGIFKSLLFENVRYSYEDLVILMNAWRRENGKGAENGNESLDTEFLDRLTEFYNQSEKKNLTNNMVEIPDLCFLYSFVYVRFVYRAVNGGSEEHDVFNINSGIGSLDNIQLDFIIDGLLGGRGTSIIAPNGFMDIGDPRSRLLDASIAEDEPFCILQIAKCGGGCGKNETQPSHFVAFAAGRFLDPKGKSIDEYGEYYIFRGVRLKGEQGWDREASTRVESDYVDAINANDSGDPMTSVRGNVGSGREEDDASSSTTETPLEL